MVDTTLSRIKSTFNNNIKLIISDIADKYDIPVNQISNIYNTDLFKKINNKICKKYKICLKKYQRQVRDELCLQYYTENKTFDTFIRYIEIVYHKNFMNITKDNIVTEFNKVSKIHILTALKYAFKSVNMDVCRKHINQMVRLNKENKISNRDLLFCVYNEFINKSYNSNNSSTTIQIVGDIDIEWEEDDNQCMARVWRKGNANSQCKRNRYNNTEYCKSHMLKSQESTLPCIKKNKKRFGLFYGRIDEPAPEKNDNNEIIISWKINNDFTRLLFN